MDLRRMARRARRENTLEHAMLRAAMTFGGFALVIQISLPLGFVLLLAFLFLKNG
ncbi:MAG: hypothetical protein COB08_012170 [Rhodobacteraceae bacterium]|nr:hypothetical protein [Paracoccaceae bacterium]